METIIHSIIDFSLLFYIRMKIMITQNRGNKSSEYYLFCSQVFDIKTKNLKEFIQRNRSFFVYLVFFSEFEFKFENFTFYWSNSGLIWISKFKQNSIVRECQGISAMHGYYTSSEKPIEAWWILSSKFVFVCLITKLIFWYQF